MMTELEKSEALAMAGKIQGNFFQQHGKLLDLTEVEHAVDTGRWNTVNKAIINLTQQAVRKGSALEQ